MEMKQTKERGKKNEQEERIKVFKEKTAKFVDIFVDSLFLCVNFRPDLLPIDFRTQNFD